MARHTPFCGDAVRKVGNYRANGGAFLVPRRADIYHATEITEDTEKLQRIKAAR
jgi:hypothetical protein